MSTTVTQDLSDPGALLVNEECRRHVLAGDGCAGGTITQDPIERFTLRIEEMRSMPGVRGPMRLLHNLFLDIFVSLVRLLVNLAERRRNGTLPELAPARAPDEPRAWPADLRPRESGWAESRDLYDPWGDSTARGRVEQAELQEPIVEAPCEMLGVEQPAGLPAPKARVRKLKVAAPCADATYANTDASSMWHVASADDAALFRPTIAGFLRRDSKKWVLAGVDTCVHFVTN